MTLQFTTKEAIAARLRGRLQLGGPAATLGGQVVDEDLIYQVGRQIESRVVAALRQIYQLPLRQTTHPELASIVEKLAIAELLPVHDQAEAATEFARLMYKQGSDELADLASGNVMLEGELGAKAPASVKPTFSRVGKRNNTGIQWTTQPNRPNHRSP